MSMLKLLLAEIGYRKVNFALSLFAITIAVALFVAGPILVDGYGRETDAELGRLKQDVERSQAQVAKLEKQQRDELAQLTDDTRVAMLGLGFNLSIVHRDTDLGDFVSFGLPSVDMPQQYVDRLAKDHSLTMITHLVATLRSKITWEGREVRLDGYLPEATQSHMRHKKPLGYTVEPGTVFLGHYLAEGREVGQVVKVLDREFHIARILPEQGSHEDSTITMHLSDVQSLLGKDHPPVINQILALECRCAIADLPKIRAQLENTLPDTYVVRDESKAVARTKQRAMVQQKYEAIAQGHQRELQQRQQDLETTKERRLRMKNNMETLSVVLTTLGVLVSAIWVGLLALANVRERIAEIGVLRALGKSSARIAFLFLAKAVLLGLAGAVIGLLLGTAVGVLLGTGATRLLGFPPLYAAADHFNFPYPLLLFALIGAPLLSAVASYLPTLSAVTQDPAVVLRDH